MKEYLINNKQCRLNILERIGTKEDAYFLGYMLGDGGFNQPTHKRKARLYISSIRQEVIDSFKNTYCPDSSVSSRLPINNKRPNIVGKNLAYTLNFSSKFEVMFKKYGLLDKKKNRVIVNIPDKYFGDYLLGLFDADGHITFGYSKDRGRLWGNFGLTHQSFQALSYVQEFLMKHLNISTTVRQRKTEDCLDLKIASLPALKKIYELMYTGVTICDKVKQSKFKELIEKN